MDDSAKKALEDKLRKELAELNKQEAVLINQQKDLKQKEDELLHTAQPQAQPAQAPPAAKADFDPSELLEGVTYLLLDSEGEASKELFMKRAKDVGSGLLISRLNPKILMKKYDLEGTTICWMSKMRAGENIKSVYGLQEISILINSFVEENPTSAVMIDGLEYLISNNDFNIVLRLIQQVRDKVSTTESVLFLPISPEVLEEKQITLLKNECEALGG